MLPAGDVFLNLCLNVLIFRNRIPDNAFFLHFGTCFMDFAIWCLFYLCFINFHPFIPVALLPNISGISIFYVSLLSVSDYFLNQCLEVLIFRNVIPMKAIILHLNTCFIHYHLSIPVVFQLNTSDISAFSLSLCCLQTTVS